MLILPRDQIRRIDQYAIETLGIPGLILMENAGRNAAQEICAFLASPTAKRVAVVAGKGNNGGDGFVVARQLGLRQAEVEVFLAAEADELTGDARTNYQAAQAAEIPIHQLDSDQKIAELHKVLSKFDLVVDALGGTGITGALRGKLASIVDQINQAGKAVVAIDIPTGLDADTGQVASQAVRAQMTVTFAAVKKGFSADGADEYTGQVRLVDIGIDAEQIHQMAERDH